MKSQVAILVWSVVAVLPSGSLLAQEKADASKKEKPPFSTRFFDRPIDFWDRGLGWAEESSLEARAEKVKDEKPPKKPAPSEWGQVVKLPDGTMSYHELPAPLVGVLENPTPENIRAYYDWRMEKAGKVLRAAQLMKEYRDQALGPSDRAADAADLARALPASLPQGGAPGLPPPAPRAPDAGKRTPFTVTYFHRKNCPHCDTEDQILAQWLRGKPEGRLEVVEFGEKPELWRALGIRGTPSLAIQDPETKKTAFLEGVSSVPVLDRALSQCRRRDDEAVTVKGEKEK